MKLKEIRFSIKQNPPQTEIELQSRILEYCIKNKIDFIEFSTIGTKWSKINKYSEGEFYNEPFAKKKETITEVNERLSKYIKDSYLQKKDFIIWFSTFFGLVNCRFYDAETNENINIEGTAREQNKSFNSLIELYHKV